ncbi:hypothetical protein Pcinc_019524 [Petrolisthes cinctipes]|uniref:SRCR domain-containing protein n=1 Tax=Petrolisthes cinctipes TaxID=88211 RepID=A0AAE1FKT9_PETCI|nr:hypothetical protein Pcinc_019524 [Petrolisthes cinctipes]
MISWTCVTNTVTVVLVLWCAKQAGGHNTNTHINNLSNLTPSEEHDGHSTPNNHNWRDNSEERKSSIFNVAAGIHQLSHSSRGKVYNSSHSPNDIATTTPTTVMVKNEERSKRDNLETPVGINANTLESSNLTASTFVNKSTEVKRVNNSTDSRPLPRPARHTEGDEESGIPSSSHEREQRGNQDDHDGDREMDDGMERRGTSNSGTGQSETRQSGTGQSGTGHREVGQSGTGNSGMRQSGMGQSWTEHSGMRQGGTGQSGTGQIGTGHREVGQSGMGNREVGQSGTGQSGMGNREVGQNGMGNREVGQSGTRQSGMGNREVGQSGTGHREVGQSGTGQKEVGQSGTGQREVGQSGTGHREVGQSGTGHREVGQSGAGHREVGHSGAGHREVGQSGTEHREVGQSGTGHREVGQSGTGHREVGQSGTEHREVGQSGAGHREVGQSGAGHSGTRQGGTEQSGIGHREVGQSVTENSGTGDSGMGQSVTENSGRGDSGMGHSGTGESGTEHSEMGQNGTGQSGTGQSGTGQSGTGQSGMGHSGMEHEMDHSGMEHEMDHSEMGHSESRESSTGRHRGDLCATCQCDPENTNVYCKHRHIYNQGESHRLRLTRAIIPPSANSLHIQGFEKVIINPWTFAADNLTLRDIHFEDIGEVELQNGSLRFSSKAPVKEEVKLRFTRCNITELPTTTLTQYESSPDQPNDHTLEGKRLLSLYIKWCNIIHIRTNALYQARLLYFTMSHTTVDVIERQGIHIDVYEDWKIEYSKLPPLVTNAICLRTQRVVIFSNNEMDGLANRSLNILSSNQVLFEYNYVSKISAGALMGVQPYRGERGANIVFLNNTVVDPENSSLAINSEYPIYERKILDNRFKVPCSCQIEEVFRALLGVPKERGTGNDIAQLTIDTVLAKSRCQRYQSVMTFIRVETYLHEICTSLPIPIIVSTVTVALAILITVTVSIICMRRVQKAKEEANYLGECSYSHSFSTLHTGPISPAITLCHSWERSGGEPSQPWVMAVPEVKTYQETELHVDFEHTEPFNGSARGIFPAEPGPILDLQRKTHMRASCPFN